MYRWFGLVQGHVQPAMRVAHAHHVRDEAAKNALVKDGGQNDDGQHDVVEQRPGQYPEVQQAHGRGKEIHVVRACGIHLCSFA